MRILLLSVVFLSLAGCVTAESRNTEIGTFNTDRGGFSYDNVHALTPSLFDGETGKLSVEYLKPARQANKSLRVTLMLRNRTDFRQTIEARTLFLGEGGMPTGDTAAWQRLFLEPKGLATYQETSMKGLEIQHFRIELRESD